MVKFHWQIYRAMLSELSKMCSCKWRTLTKAFGKLARCRRGKFDKLLLVCWHLAKIGNTINTLCLLFKVFKTNVMCVGLERKRVGPMTNSCKKWSKAVKPLLYFLIELICARFHFCWFIFCTVLQMTKRSVSYSITGTRVLLEIQHMLKNNKLCLISMRTWLIVRCTETASPSQSFQVVKKTF